VIAALTVLALLGCAGSTQMMVHSSHTTSSR